MLNGTYKMIIAVCYSGDAFIVDTGELPQRECWLDWNHCEDNGFRNIPENKGIHECIVELHAFEDDWYFQIIDSKLLIKTS